MEEVPVFVPIITQTFVKQEVWDQFNIDLESARNIYDKKTSAEELGTNLRSSAILALNSTMKFLEHAGVANMLLSPLNSLNLALADLSEGRSNGMLARMDSGPNRSHSPLEHEIRVAQAAAYIELTIFERGRKSLKDAILLISREFDISPSQMREKRKNIANGRSVSAECFDYYNFLLREGKSRPPAQLKNFLFFLLREIGSSKSPPKKSRKIG